ncbi:hypothetical protein BJV82DRAFT_505327, partial [Fennellomyces sp. T-0311]
ESLGISQRFSTAYHRRGDGIAERHVQTATQIIRKKIKGAVRDWDYCVVSTKREITIRISKRLQTPPLPLKFAQKVNSSKSGGDEKLRSSEPLTYEDPLKQIENMQEIVSLY